MQCTEGNHPEDLPAEIKQFVQPHVNFTQVIMIFNTLITWTMAALAVASPLGLRSENGVTAIETSPVSLLEWAGTNKAMRSTDDEIEAPPAPLIEWRYAKKTIRSTDGHEASPAPLIEWAGTSKA
ncbi:hypothetical protein NHQ30_008449 [Ciborinia camelliae]|nr:hypothetical protein NHQ30_008449 [Ciborinia camelliae]